MLLLILGAIIVLVISVEIVVTVTMSGGGLVAMLAPITASRVFHNAKGEWRMRPWPSLGMMMIVGTVALWFVLLWLGWFMIFMSDPQAVVQTGSGEPADVASRIYFSGYTLSTLGIGDYSPGGALWQILTAIASLTSFFLFTFSISFFVPMVQGEMQRRRTALYIHHLGNSPVELLERCYHPEREDQMPVLSSLVEQLIKLEQIHRRYPVIHYSGSRSQRYALVLAIAKLDEALMLLTSCQSVRKDERIHAARHAIHGLLVSTDALFVRLIEDPPPNPSYADLSNSELDFEDFDSINERFDEERERRRMLHSLVLIGGWTWDDLLKGDTQEAPTAVRFFFDKV